MHMGFIELLIVLVIVLIFVGPKQIPKLAETCGKAITSFKKGVNDGAVDSTAEKVSDSLETEA